MTELSISAQPNEVEYVVTTSEDTFAAPFEFFQEADVRVAVTDDATGVLTEHLFNAGFTFDSLVSPVGQEGIGFVSGVVLLDTPVTNSKVKVYRSTVVDRVTNFSNTGPFSNIQLNHELNKITAILQELDTQKAQYISVPDSSTSDTPYDADGRAVCNIGESALDDCAATNRQVDANGPNGIEKVNAQTAVGTNGQWNNVYSISDVVIEGNETTKLFDLMNDFVCSLQNRGGSAASFYVRLRYTVECYSEVTHVMSSVYPMKIDPTSAIPLHIRRVDLGIDYLNGLGTLVVAVDIYPLDANSTQMYTQWKSMTVNTSEPRV